MPAKDMDDLFQELLGIDIEGVKEKIRSGKMKEFNFWTYSRETMEKIFSEHMGIRIEGKERIIIDYDENCSRVLVRKEIGSAEHRGAPRKED